MTTTSMGTKIEQVKLVIYPIIVVAALICGYTIRGCQDDAAIERKRIRTMETTVRRVDRKLGLFDALPTTWP